MLFSYEGFRIQLKDYGLFRMATNDVGRSIRCRLHLTVENLNYKAILNDIETNTYEREATGSPASWLDSDNQWYD